MVVLWLFVLVLCLSLPQVQSTCEPPPSDTCLVIDKTKSVGAANYDTMLDGVKILISKYDVGTNKTHFAIVTYAGEAEVRVRFNESYYYSKEALYEFIDEMKASDTLGSPTRTDKALDVVNKEIFVAESGDRPLAHNEMIIFTDGGTHKNSEPYSTVIPPLDAKDVVRTAVGIGNNIAQSELETIAGSPDQVVIATSFEDLNAQLAAIREISCTEPEIITHPNNVTKKEGENVTLSCSVTGIPTPDVKWTKDSSNINTDSRVTISQDGTQLTITNVTRTDDGIYRCVANNSEGNRTSDPATLTVLSGPELITHPQSVTKNERENVTLSCSATGSPTPDLKWTKDATDINTDSRVTLSRDGTQLTITYVTRIDDGIYRCVANNSEGNRTSDPATLTVLYGPELITHPQSVTKNEGENVTLSCSATGSPTPDIKWTKDATNINTDSRVTISQDGTQLTITNVTSTDDGIYRCVANNSEGNRTSDPAALTVLYGPELITDLQSVTKNEGENVTLSCSATGSPTPDIKWTKDVTDINTDSRVTISHDGTQLTLTNVTRTDDGIYRCVANNSEGNITSNPATLTVLSGLELITHPQSITKNERENVTLSCSATGSPTPDIKWTKDATDINTDSRVTISQDGTQLTITTVTKTDDGIYRCVANNSEGNRTSDPATLTVLYGPELITHPQSVTKNEGDNVTLSCSATGTPTPDIKWTKDATDINTDSRVTISQNGTQLTITNVTRTDDGIYRCVVNNNEGNRTSDPATLTVRSGLELITHPQSVTKNIGDNVTLSCSATGSPTPDLKWTKDVTDINTDSRVTISHDGTQLTITNVSRTDDGIYRCVANNSEGNRTSDPATLTVLSGLELIIHPQSATKKEGENVTLSCSATGSPTPDIKWTKDATNINTDSRVTISQDGTQLTITNVTSTDDGIYRCVANNSEGNRTSDPATLTVLFSSGVDSDPSASVNCGTDGRNITITISNVTDLNHWSGKEDKWRLNNDADCQPTFGAGSVTYGPFDGWDCASLASTSSEFVYTFQVHAAKDAGNTPVRAYDHCYQITCKYQRDGTVQSAFVPIHELQDNAMDTENMIFSLALYADALHSTSLPDPIALGDTIYVQVNVTHQFGVNLDLLLDECYTSTDSQGSNGRFELIVDSCDTGNDDTLSYNCGGQTLETEDFDFQAYRYPGQPDTGGADVWLHCGVYACRTGNSSSRCQTQCTDCSDRKRRETGQFMDDTKYEVTSGPYRFVDNEKAQTDTTEGRKDHPSSLAKLVVILSASGGVVAIAVVCVMVLILLRKRRQLITITKTTASEMGLENPGCEARGINKNI